MPFSSHEEYFQQASTEVRPLLKSIQKSVETRIPDASRCISYGLPAFKAERVFFFFAAFKKHIGIYPPVADPALIEELKAFRGVKGNLSFPLNQPLPIDLIGRVAVTLRQEYRNK